MRLWRISNYADLSGIGGLQTAGRWHNRGVPIVYLAESPALAMLEVLVNFELSLDEVPLGYQLLEVDYAQRKGVSRLSRSALVKGWQADPELTRAIGDEWIAAGTSALLKVPSVVVPNSYNYLFNPRHSEAAVAVITTITRHPFDSRLFS